MNIKLKRLTLDHFKGENLIGQKFGRLTVIRFAGKSKYHIACWLCECDCGNVITTRGSCLKNGSAQSCGCLRKENALKACTTHGLSGGRNQPKRIYRIWRNMKSRCSNPKTPKYKNYGGRGITVCSDWLTFENFYNWAMANGYRDNLTIERIDNDGDYCPENCKWATYKEQALNSRQNHIISYEGKSKTLKEWAAILGMKYTTLEARLNQYGWDIEKAINEPIRRRVAHGN